MATDLEKLVVQLSADVKSYENAMAKATGVTKTQLKALKAEAANAGAASGAAFTGAAAGVTKFGASAGAATGNVRALTTQTNLLKGSTGNLAAQINDIGVQLAGGQSPFLIAIQQGSQINQVLGGAGARGAVAALGGAITSLINPVSLATFGIIALGGLAIQYFSTLADGGAKSAEELKEQAALIKRVADEWGGAVPAVKAYADEVANASRVEDLRAAGDVVIADIWEKPREDAARMEVELSNLTAILQSLGTETSGIAALQDAFFEFSEKVEEGTATAEDAKAVQAALISLMSSGVPAVAAFAASFDGLAASIDSSANSAARAQSEINGALNAMRQFRAAESQSRANLPIAQQTGAQVIAEQERRNSLTKEQLALETEIASIKSNVAGAGGIIAPDVALKLAEQTLAAEQRRADIAKAETAAAKKSGGGRDKAATEAERERAAVVKLIEALQFEQSLIGSTDIEREKANALRRAGSAATAEQRAQIEALVSASYAETEALKATEDQMERLKGLSKDVLGGIFEDLRDGASAADVLANALNRVAESFVLAGIDRIIENSFSGGGVKSGGLFGGRIIPGILHKGGVAGQDGYGHGRSFPLSAFTGAPRYHSGGVAGFRPGEIPAVLQRGERVIPKGGGAGSVSQTINIINPTGNSEIERSVAAGVARGNAQMRREVPGIVMNTQKRHANG